LSFNKHIITQGRSKLILSLLLFVSPFGHLLSQNINSPVTSEEVRSELDKLFGVDQRLVSGNFYIGARSGSVTGHPYYFDEKWKKGSVTIDGIKFEDLLLKFDIVSNSVVLNTYNLNNSSTHLCLNKEKISEFSMNRVKFIRLPRENRDKKIIFAQLCSEGSIDFLLVIDKDMVTANIGSTDFKYMDFYQNYLGYKGQIIKFKNIRTLFKLFPEFKSEIKKYLSGNNLTTRKKETHNRTMLVNYCNSLIRDSK
jgi:hypothetical protein